MTKLRKNGIDTRPFFWPMHKQKILNKLNLIHSNNFPNSEYISKYGFYLPSSLSLKNSEIDYICDKLNYILSKKNWSLFDIKVIINKKQYIYLILIFCIEFFSIYYARFYYDGFHLGLLINAAADIDAGKLIYKDFFYEYGLLNVYLKLLILKISNFNIFSLFVVYIQFYIAGIFLLYLTTKNLLNINYAILLVIIFLWG